MTVNELRAALDKLVAERPEAGGLPVRTVDPVGDMWVDDEVEAVFVEQYGAGAKPHVRFRIKDKSFDERTALALMCTDCGALNTDRRACAHCNSLELVPRTTRAR